ncbi:MAG: MFS transporter [Eubacterium sp.]|nr:MFS transporter [Eubacterium sp.]
MSDKKQDALRYVGVKENLAYGFANAGQVFGYNLFAGGYLSLFFTKVFGIPASAVGTMILILGMWDAINDPLMGSLIDKTRTRYGKLRPYLLIVPIPLAITTVMVFAGPELLANTKNLTVKIVYMYVSYIIWELFYTLGDVPFWGMSAAISPLPSDRTRAISTARFISSLLGGLSLTFIPVMMDLTNNGVWGLTLSQDFLILSIIAAGMILGLFSLAGRKTKERVVQSIKEPSLLDGIKVLFKNKPLLMIILGNVIGTLTGLAGVYQTYYYSEVLNLSSAVLWISLPGTIFGFLTYLLIPKLQKKLDNKQIIMLNITVRFVVGLITFLAGLKFYKTSIVAISILLMIQNFVFSFFNTINMVIPMEMIGDTIDYMEWKTGERNEGIAFSVATFIAKLTSSVSTSLGTMLLGVIGLSFTTMPDGSTVAHKAENTDLYIWALFTLVPWVLGLLSMIPYFFYDLTGEKLEKIRTEMKERRNELSIKVSGGEELEQHMS